MHNQPVDPPKIDVDSFKRYVFKRLIGVPQESGGRPTGESLALKKRLNELLFVLEQIEARSGKRN